MSKIDSELIDALKKGKRRARSKLYKQMSAPMLSVCLRYTQNRMEAEDVLHDGFIKVFEKIDQYQSKGVFEGWVRRIIANTAIQYLRDKSKLNETSEREYPNDSLLSDVEIDFPIDSGQLMGLVNNLPDGYRLIFNMYVMEDYSHKEIAKTLSISEGTSKSQLFNAKHALRKQVQEVIDKQN